MRIEKNLHYHKDVMHMLCERSNKKIGRETKEMDSEQCPWIDEKMKRGEWLKKRSISLLG